MPIPVIGQLLSRDALLQKREEYKALAAQLQRDSIANEGAAQAIDALIQEMAEMEQNQPGSNPAPVDKSESES